MEYPRELDVHAFESQTTDKSMLITAIPNQWLWGVFCHINAKKMNFINRRVSVESSIVGL